jgi:SRSO17 transposase
LAQAERKNMERMAESVPDTDEQALHHFLSNSPWDADGVVGHVAERANDVLEKGDRCLLIDETGIPKKGEKSVGVARQWCGSLGKVDNCQVGVFAVLGRGKHAAPIDYRLYLPKVWVDDEKRCRLAGVPSHRMAPLRKHDLALEMVRAARKRGIDFSWVGFDGFYGEDPTFLRQLDQDGEIFMADVHCDQRIWLEDPRPQVPQRRSRRGRKPEKLKARSKPLRVDKWVYQQPPSAWRRVQVRDTTKGELVVDMLHQRVWLWDREEPGAHQWHLVVRREVDGSKTKYSLSNAPEGTPLARLAFQQAQRFWVERAFQDAKQHCGLDEYQARGWRGWHHHMALVLMSMQFMLEQRLRNQDLYPLLSCADIVSLLKHFLPKRAADRNEVFRQMEVRHKKRQAAIDSAYKIQGVRPDGA